MSRCYTVEIERLCRVLDVEANTPKQALKNVIKEYDICNASIMSITADTKTQYRKAKVSLMDGARKTVSYFEVSW